MKAAKAARKMRSKFMGKTFKLAVGFRAALELVVPGRTKTNNDKITGVLRCAGNELHFGLDGDEKKGVPSRNTLLSVRYQIELEGIHTMRRFLHLVVATLLFAVPVNAFAWNNIGPLTRA